MLGEILIYVGVVLMLNGIGRLYNVNGKTLAVFNTPTITTPIDNLSIKLKKTENTYQLYEAHSAAEGFDILETVMPDLILLDIVMPDMDGFEMLKKLKMNKRLRNIPVIFLTAENSPEAEVEGFNCGVVDYITKPFVPVVMLKRIETQIALAEYENNLEERVAEKVVEMEKMYDLISVSFAGLVESRDGVTDSCSSSGG